jgi:hypothetical protein
MKGYLFTLIAIVILSSCSTPKYTYHFDHYDYNSGKRKKLAEAAASAEAISHTVIDKQTLVASSNENEVYLTKPAPAVSKEEAIAKINSMSNDEKKELKREVKKYVKENKKEIKSGKSTKELENDVKLAAIFGAVGLVLLIIGGDVIYILGAVALLIGLYFFIRWLVRQ